MNTPVLFVMKCGSQFFVFPADPDTRGRTPLRNKPQRWGGKLRMGERIRWGDTIYHLVWIDRDWRVIYGSTCIR